MPIPGQTNNSPGLILPVFGDTGIDTNGITTGGDQSLFLEQGNFHYYGILVSTQNVGVLRARLEAVSGNPDIYLRFGSVPTLQHNLTGASGTIFDRSMLALTTEYANWVPLDGKTETKLKPGFWFLAVRAAGNANARYRLQVSAGNIQDIPIQGANLTDQVLAGGDWRYYRVQVPNEPPSTWQINFAQQSGDVVMYLRDTLPPGNGNTAIEFKDWTSDAKNSGPYGSYDVPGTYSFNVPPIRPGSVYYLGFRAVNDATFSLTTSTPGSVLNELPTIDFYGGNVTLNVAPSSQLSYRINVSPEGTRWKHSSLHTTNLLLFVEQGTLPSRTSGDDWKSSSANSSLNQYLLTAWPWIPNQSYFLTVTNPSSSSQSFSFTMDGRNAATDDNDNDFLPDAWELQYFGNLAQTANADGDGDGVSNLLEFQEGTSPADKGSYRPRLTTSATNGVIVRSPNDTSYPLDSTVWLTPMPNPGYAFVSWSGQASGADAPLALLMSTNKSVTGLFKIIGDEFSTRVPVSGTVLSVTGSTIGTTKEAGEPNHAGNFGGKSIWWTWTAPVSGTVTLSTAGSAFNTLLAVYTGSSVSALTLVAGDNNSLGGTNRSRVTFNAIAGTPYQLAVDGFNSASGSAALSLVISGWSQLSAPAVVGNALQLTLNGEPNGVYSIEFSTNLVDWTSVRSVTNISGTLNVTNPISSGSPQGYYRLRHP